MHSVRLADSIDAPSIESYLEILPDVPDNIGFANKVTAIGYIKLILPPLFAGTLSVVDNNYQVTQLFPVAVSTYLCGQATIFANKSSFNTKDWNGSQAVHILNATPNSITFVIDAYGRQNYIKMSVGYVILAKSI